MQTSGCTSVVLCLLLCWPLSCSAARSLVGHAVFCMAMFLPAAASYSLLPMVQGSPSRTFPVLSDEHESWCCSISDRVWSLLKYPWAPRSCLSVCVTATLDPQPVEDLLSHLQGIYILCPKLRYTKPNTESVLLHQLFSLTWLSVPEICVVGFFVLVCLFVFIALVSTIYFCCGSPCPLHR